MQRLEWSDICSRKPGKTCDDSLKSPIRIDDRLVVNIEFSMARLRRNYYVGIWKEKISLLSPFALPPKLLPIRASSTSRPTPHLLDERRQLCNGLAYEISALNRGLSRVDVRILIDYLRVDVLSMIRRFMPFCL